MGRLIYAHWKKTKGTFVRTAIVLLPILYSVLLFLYFKVSIASTANAAAEYQAFFLFLTISVQFVLSIMIPLTLQEDLEAGHYGNELRVGVPRSALFISRYLMVLLLSFIVECIALITFVTLNTVFRSSFVPLQTLGIFLLSSIFFLMPIALVYLVVAFRYRLTGSLMVGVFFILSGILLGTTDLGTGMWQYIPWVWAIRIMYETIPALLWVQSSNTELIGSLYTKVCVSALFLTFFLLTISLIWYNHWEGMADLEE